MPEPDEVMDRLTRSGAAVPKTSDSPQPASTASEQLIAWILGATELVLATLLGIWLLTSPTLFRADHPKLGFSSGRDGIAIVEWLKTGYRERSLAIAVTEGKLLPKELAHYADVRRVLQRVPGLILGLVATLGLVLGSGRIDRSGWKRVQWRALGLWLMVVLAIGTGALWNWNRLFALLHYPLFGSDSWRLPSHAYSLTLFPAAFWRGAGVCVLLLAAALPGVIAGFLVAGGRERRPLAPKGKMPTAL